MKNINLYAKPILMQKKDSCMVWSTNDMQSTRRVGMMLCMFLTSTSKVHYKNIENKLLLEEQFWWSANIRDDEQMTCLFKFHCAYKFQESFKYIK